MYRILLICFFSIVPINTSVLSAQSIVRSNETVEAVDGRQLQYHVERTETDEPIPLVVVIDGSGCLGAMRAGFAQLLAPSEYLDLSFARLVVGKSGVPSDQADPDLCSEEFLQNYSMQARVLDHMRILQELRISANWWSGELLIFGWSDGGDVAAQLFAYTPDGNRLAFGGVGGGFTMREHFENYWACP